MIRIYLILSIFLFAGDSCTKAQNIQLHGVIRDSFPPPVTDQYLDIYIIMGQSNSQGRATSSDLVLDLYKYLSYPMQWWYTKSYIINQTYNPMAYAQLQAGVNTTDAGSQAGKWGIQPKLAWELMRYKNRDIYFLQNSLGGTEINLWRPSGGFMMDSLELLVTRTNAYAVSLGKTARYKAAVWWQYEQDVFNGTDSTTYINALRTVISDTRSYTGNSTLPFLIVQGLACQVAGGNFNSLYSNIQVIVGAESNNYLVPALGTETCSDAAHASAATYVLKSSQIFNLIKDL
jgi:hypothetical protein